MQNKNTKFSLWPVKQESFSKRTYNQASFTTTNPWALIRGCIDKNLASKSSEKEIAQPLADQAEFFFTAQAATDKLAAKSLLLYYSAMNLVKTCLIVRGNIKGAKDIKERNGFRHGIESDFTEGSADDPIKNSIITIKRSRGGKSQIEIFDEFLRLFNCHIRRRAKIRIKLTDILPQVVTGHKLWSHFLGEKDYFLPLEKLEFFVQPEIKKICVLGKIKITDSRRISGTHFESITNSGLSNKTEIINAEPEADCWSFKLPSKRYTVYSTDMLEKIAGDIRNQVWSVVTSTHPYRKYYFYAIGTERETVMPQLASMYAIMFFLGSVSRYRPHFFNRLLKSKYGPLINEFLTSVPNQFLYLMASEIAMRDVSRPAVI